MAHNHLALASRPGEDTASSRSAPSSPVLSRRASSSTHSSQCTIHATFSGSAPDIPNSPSRRRSFPPNSSSNKILLSPMSCQLLHQTSQLGFGVETDTRMTTSPSSSHHPTQNSRSASIIFNSSPVTKLSGMSHSDGYLDSGPISPPLPNSNRRDSHQFGQVPFDTSNHKRERRHSSSRQCPSYMRSTCASEKKRCHVLQLGDDDQSDHFSEEQKSPTTTSEFHPPIVLPPIWTTSAGKTTPLHQWHSVKKVVPTIKISTVSALSSPFLKSDNSSSQ